MTAKFPALLSCSPETTIRRKQSLALDLRNRIYPSHTYQQALNNTHSTGIKRDVGIAYNTPCCCGTAGWHLSPFCLVCCTAEVQRSLKIAKHSSCGSRLFNVIEYVTNQKGICDFLVINSNLGRISHGFGFTGQNVASKTYPSHLMPPLRATLVNMLMNLILPERRERRRHPQVRMASCNDDGDDKNAHNENTSSFRTVFFRKRTKPNSALKISDEQ